MALFELKPEVAAKYSIDRNLLNGQKLVFTRLDHTGVKNQPAHTLTLDDVDKLHAAGCDVFTLNGSYDGPAANLTADTTTAATTAKKKKKNDPSSDTDTDSTSPEQGA